MVTTDDYQLSLQLTRLISDLFPPTHYYGNKLENDHETFRKWIRQMEYFACSWSLDSSLDARLDIIKHNTRLNL